MTTNVVVPNFTSPTTQIPTELPLSSIENLTQHSLNDDTINFGQQNLEPPDTQL